nr:olfactory receptor 1019-like [Zootoca vivipara]
MEYTNHTIVTEFILLGFMDHPELWTILFLAFLLIYIVTVSGNLGIIILAALDANLHTPMYFFLSNLSLVDRIIKLLKDNGFVNSVVQTSLIFSLSFCSSNVINHFFCDVPPMLKLSCSSTEVANTVHFIFATAIIMTSLLIIVISYTYIIVAILRIRSAQGRHKAFSTCASHFLAVTIFYGTIIFMYMRPNSSVAKDGDKTVSVFYALVIPMLNPLIYSLRNKDVKNAFLRMSGKISLN